MPITGKDEVIVARVSRITNETLSSADVALSPGTDYTVGDPWITVTREHYGPAWPPRIGDVVTVTVPRVLKIERKG